MDDLQRAQRLLNSPIEGDHRKVIKLLAKSGDRWALALLRQAYDNAQSAEIKQMALKGGAYLKEKLRAEVLAPAADPITFDLPEDHYDLDEPHTSAIQPEIEADWMTSVVKGESKAQKKARKKGKPKSREGNRTEMFAAGLVMVMSLVLIFAWGTPWDSVDNLTVAPGITVAQDIASAIPVDTPHATFTPLNISSVLQGERSPWWLFTTPDQIDVLFYDTNYLSVYTDTTTQYADYTDEIVSFASVFMIILIMGMSYAILSKGNSGWSRFGLLLIFFRWLPNRITWAIMLIFTLLYASILLIFLFDVLPRFAQATIDLMRLGNPVYKTYQLLDYGFFITVGATIAILFSIVWAFSSYSTDNGL